MKRWLALGGAAFVAAGVMAISAAATTSVVAYNNIPTPTPANVPSVGGEAYAFNELGGQVHLAGTERRDPSVTVLMSSWGCESGHWYSNDCTTTPGSHFTVPITLSVYNVGSANTVGTRILTKQQTFEIPYRPSYDSTNCTGGRWFNASDSKCYNGYGTPITFKLSDVSLPTDVILSVAYNTSHYGYAPIGEAAACYTSSGGCGYDSLNIGLITTAPTVGSDPTPNALYQNSSLGAEYCDNGANGVGSFRLDDGCWAPYQPAFTVTAKPLCRVPDLIGMTINDAKTAITAASCKVGVITKKTVGAGPHTYIVVNQHPKAGGTSLSGWVSFTAKG